MGGYADNVTQTPLAPAGAEGEEASVTRSLPARRMPQIGGRDRVRARPDIRRPRSRLRSYVALTKPRIIELLLVTTLPSMILAADGLPDWTTVLVTLVGGALAAGDRKSTRLNSSHSKQSRMPSSA